MSGSNEHENKRTDESGIMKVELLIYNKEHFMDAWSPTDLNMQILKDSDIERKYKARYQKGDVVEVQREGFYKNGFDKTAFSVITVDVPNMEFISPMTESQKDINHRLLLNRKRKVDITDMVFVNNRIEFNSTSEMTLIQKEAVKIN